MDDLQPGAVFGEINMIQGTLCNASFRGETEGTVYIISKEQFLLALSQSDDVPQSLIPPTTYLPRLEMLYDVELLLHELLWAGVKSDAGAPGAHNSAISQSLAANFEDMQSARARQRVLQQLSVISWLSNPTESFRKLVLNEASKTMLESFAQKTNEILAKQLSLVVDTVHNAYDAEELLRHFGTEVDVEIVSPQQLVEWLELKVSAVIDELTNELLPLFVRSDECSRLVDDLCETPSKGGGLPAIAMETQEWLEMFGAATEKLPHAISVVDVQVAGLPLVFVNEAWEQLTGYGRSDALGRNARMLQGEATETDAVAELVASIRARRRCTVRLTNYTQAGTAFANELSVHPVSDSRGVYRFMVGVMGDAESTVETRAMLAAVRDLLPEQFPAVLSAHGSNNLSGLDVYYSDHQLQEASVHFARAVSLEDMEGTLRRVLAYPKAVKCLMDALPDDVCRNRLQAFHSAVRTSNYTTLLSHPSFVPREYTDP